MDSLVIFTIIAILVAIKLDFIDVLGWVFIIIAVIGFVLLGCGLVVLPFILL